MAAFRTPVSCLARDEVSFLSSSFEKDGLKGASVTIFVNCVFEFVAGLDHVKLESVTPT